MRFIPLKIPEVILIEPKVFGDDRGFFYESYRETFFCENGIHERFVQDNHSRSMKGVLRGLHFQISPRAQAKLVRVIRGEVFDVAVDLRKGSKTFGQHVGEFLNESNKKMIYIPKGFAHGFCVTQENTEFLYKCSDVYSIEHERGLFWNDPDLEIPWPKLDCDFILSEKDQHHSLFKDLKDAFE